MKETQRMQGLRMGLWIGYKSGNIPNGSSANGLGPSFQVRHYGTRKIDFSTTMTSIATFLTVTLIGGGCINNREMYRFSII